MIDPGVGRAAFAIAPHLPSEPNRAFSPLSAWIALQMLAAGTAGETRAELESVLGPPTGFWNEREAKNVGAFFAAISADPSLVLANGVWTPAGAPPRPAFVEDVRARFGAAAAEVRGDPVPVVNAWTRDRTEGRIPTILDRVDPSWSAILVNAMLYRGRWSDPFDPKLTSPAPFHAKSGDVAVPMMRRTGWMRYGEFGGQPAVALPLAGEYALVATLPPPETDPWTWLGAQGKRSVPSPIDFHPTQVILSLPRLTIGDAMDLVAPLRAAGARRIFGGGDFSPMFAAGTHAVSQIAQRTTLTLDETGAEASAATAIVTSRSSPPPRPEAVTLTFDRPFAYLLVHLPTRAPLVMGVYGEPPR